MDKGKNATVSIHQIADILVEHGFLERVGEEKKPSNLVEAIGIPAMLEQTAEEATELAFACLKLARFYRGENVVYGHTEADLKENLAEELADIRLCASELTDSGVIKLTDIYDWEKKKQLRMHKRLRGESEE